MIRQPKIMVNDGSLCLSFKSSCTTTHMYRKIWTRISLQPDRAGSLRDTFLEKSFVDRIKSGFWNSTLLASNFLILTTLQLQLWFANLKLPSCTNMSALSNKLLLRPFPFLEKSVHTLNTPVKHSSHSHNTAETHL